MYVVSPHGLGDVAQLGERVNGIHEVRGSIPLVSTEPLVYASSPTSGAEWYTRGRWVFPEPSNRTDSASRISPGRLAQLVRAPR